MEIAVGKLTRDNFTEFSTKARIEKKSSENSCKFLEAPFYFVLKRNVQEMKFLFVKIWSVEI